MEQFIIDYIKKHHDQIINGCLIQYLCSSGVLLKDKLLLDMSIIYVNGNHMDEDAKGNTHIKDACFNKCPMSFIQALYDAGVNSHIDNISHLSGEHLEFALKYCDIDIPNLVNSNNQLWNNAKLYVPTMKGFKYTLFDIIGAYQENIITCSMCIGRLLAIGADPSVVDEYGKRVTDYLSSDSPLIKILRPKSKIIKITIPDGCQIEITHSPKFDKHLDVTYLQC